jgi:hypothetical protein
MCVVGTTYQTYHLLQRKKKGRILVPTVMKKKQINKQKVTHLGTGVELVKGGLEIFQFRQLKFSSSFSNKIVTPLAPLQFCPS